jgi:hypothetical protein
MRVYVIMAQSVTAGCLDIAFCEDESPVRKGHAPVNLGLLRRISESPVK